MKESRDAEQPADAKPSRKDEARQSTRTTSGDHQKASQTDRLKAAFSWRPSVSSENPWARLIGEGVHAVASARAARDARLDHRDAFSEGRMRFERSRER